jgi:hypothetical protein
MSTKEILELAGGVDDLKMALEQGYDVTKEYAAAVNTLTTSQQAGVQAVKTLSGTMNAFNAAFATGMNIIAKNIDQQVNLYQKTITAIAAQNTYTQGIALESEAKAIYGVQSEQATRATTAANYVGALYTQAKKNEAVASEQLTTATITNLANLALEITDMIAPIQALATAITVWRAATMLATAATVASTGAEETEAAAVTGVSLLGAGIMQGGAHVKESGFAYLHGGETVTPAGSMGSGTPNIEIHIHASSNVDLAKVRQEVQNAIAQALYRGQKSRGVY